MRKKANKALKRKITDAAALKEIFDLMEEADEWDSDTTSSIEAIIQKTGREFTDKNGTTHHYKKQLSVEDVVSLYPNFALESAGGGGKAWKHPTDDGGQIVVTGVGSPFAPPAYATEVSVGRYDRGFAAGSRPVEFHRKWAVKKLEELLDRMLGV